MSNQTHNVTITIRILDLNYLD